MAKLITVTSFRVFHPFFMSKDQIIDTCDEKWKRTLKTPKVRRKQCMGFIDKKQEGKHLVRMGIFGKKIKIKILN